MKMDIFPNRYFVGFACGSALAITISFGIMRSDTNRLDHFHDFLVDANSSSQSEIKRLRNKCGDPCTSIEPESKSVINRYLNTQPIENRQEILSYIQKEPPY